MYYIFVGWSVAFQNDQIAYIGSYSFAHIIQTTSTNLGCKFVYSMYTTAFDVIHFKNPLKKIKNSNILPSLIHTPYNLNLDFLFFLTNTREFLWNFVN